MLKENRREIEDRRKSEGRLQDGRRKVNWSQKGD